MQLLFEMMPVVVAARRDIVRLFGKIECWRRIMPEICEEGRVIRAIRRDEHLLRLLQQPVGRGEAERVDQLPVCAHMVQQADLAELCNLKINDRARAEDLDGCARAVFGREDAEVSSGIRT